MNITISEPFKKTIKDYIDRSDVARFDEIFLVLDEDGWIDQEFGHLIFGSDERNAKYDPVIDALVIDAIEDEIKAQLLKKFNE